MNTDLTVGKPWKVLIKYLLPLFGSAVFQQFYTIADTVIAGRFAGQTALTAIGSSMAIVNILMAVAFGANAGCSVLSARYFGANDNKSVKITVYTALITFGVLSVTLMAIGALSCRATLIAMQTPQEALEESVVYLNIYYFGLPFLILYNLGTGVFSSLGDSRTPFFFLVFSSVTNVILDYIMVQSMGVAGVAWATFIAQGTACIMTLVVVFFRIKKLPCDGKAKPFSFGILKKLLWLAFPVMLQNSFVSVGNLFIQVKINALATLHGIGVSSGFTAGFKIVFFGVTCFCSCANGFTNYVSQNYGAEEYARIKRGFLSVLAISSTLCVFFTLIFMIFAEPLVKLFMPSEEDIALAIRTGAEYARIVSPFFLVVNIKVSADSAVRGCNGNVGFMVSTFSDLILRVGFVYILTGPLGTAGVGWSWALGWIIGTVIALIFYFNVPCLKRKKLKKAEEQAAAQPNGEIEEDVDCQINGEIEEAVDCQPSEEEGQADIKNSVQ